MNITFKDISGQECTARAQDLSLRWIGKPVLRWVYHSRNTLHYLYPQECLRISDLLKEYKRQEQSVVTDKETRKEIFCSYNGKLNIDTTEGLATQVSPPFTLVAHISGGYKDTQYSILHRDSYPYTEDEEDFITKEEYNRLNALLFPEDNIPIPTPHRDITPTPVATPTQVASGAPEDTLPKVGDYIKVLPEAKTLLEETHNWSPDMKDTIGNTYEVVYVTSNKTGCTIFTPDKHNWFIPNGGYEIVPKPEDSPAVTAPNTCKHAGCTCAEAESNRKEQERIGKLTKDLDEILSRYIDEHDVKAVIDILLRYLGIIEA